LDIIKNIKNEINSLTKREIGYIIITGGITSMLGFNAIIEELFIKNANVINIGIIGIRDNKYSSAYGIGKYLVEKFELRDKEYTMFSKQK
jgi:cell division ATPase FtsA